MKVVDLRAAFAARPAGALVGILLGACLSAATAVGAPSSAGRPVVIDLGIPATNDPDDSAGGIIVADVNDDDAPDYLVTIRGYLTVCANDGQTLWTKQLDIVVGGSSESEGLPGHHGPGVAAGDVDGDGKCEVVFLTRDSTLHIVEGATGREEAAAKPPVPDGAQRWEVALLADFRGTGADGDILLQATNSRGYRTGRYLAAYRTAELLTGGRPLWTTDTFVSCAHNAARLADLNGDGRDEVLGATIYSAEGQPLTRAAEFHGHMDSVFVADVTGDWREEIIVRNGAELHVYQNGAPNPRPHEKRLWSDRNYRRRKQCHNYYSP